MIVDGGHEWVAPEQRQREVEPEMALLQVEDIGPKASHPADELDAHRDLAKRLSQSRLGEGNELDARIDGLLHLLDRCDWQHQADVGPLGQRVAIRMQYSPKSNATKAILGRAERTSASAAARLASPAGSQVTRGAGDSDGAFKRSIPLSAARASPPYRKKATAPSRREKAEPPHEYTGRLCQTARSNAAANNGKQVATTDHLVP